MLLGRFRLRVDGLDGIRDYALQVRENADDLRPALRVVAENLRRWQRSVFQSEGAKLLGRPWDALAPRTVEARRRRWGHYAKPPKGEKPTRRRLHWTHALRRSLTEDRAEGAVASVSASTLIFGTTIPYAAAADARRRFFEFPDATVTTEILQPMQQHLLGRDPRLGQGRRRTRRVGGVARSIESYSEAAD